MTIQEYNDPKWTEDNGYMPGNKNWSFKDYMIEGIILFCILIMAGLLWIKIKIKGDNYAERRIETYQYDPIESGQELSEGTQRQPKQRAVEAY